MADNWYVVLELEFDPPLENEQVIAEKIEERSKFWATHFNDFKKGAQYRTWHQNIPQIKKDMIGPANIRKQLAEEACASAYAPIDKLLKTIGRKGNITSDEGERLAKKQKVSIELVKKRANSLGIHSMSRELIQIIKLFMINITRPNRKMRQHMKEWYKCCQHLGRTLYTISCI